MGFLGKLFGIKEKESLDQGLQQTKEGFFAKITKAIAVPTWEWKRPFKLLKE
jgi:fused signal recognition particle receptor